MKKYSLIQMTSALLLGLAANSSGAASISVQVLNAAGQPLANSVVYAETDAGKPGIKPLRVAEIEQKQKTFMPLVTVIQTGTAIAFPNNDTVRHHVYSFSPAKKLDMKLYSGLPAGPPEVFDKAGTVVIGCNIHDQMIAYIYVVDTPYFARTDAFGTAKIDDVPVGKVRLKAWHYGVPSAEPVAEQQLTLTATGASASFKLKTLAAPPPVGSKAPAY